MPGGLSPGTFLEYFLHSSFDNASYSQNVTGDFVVTPGDFDIDIPKIVQNKIAKEVQVTIDFKLRKNETQNHAFGMIREPVFVPQGGTTPRQARRRTRGRA